MMRRYLLRQADQAAQRWKADYEKRKTPEGFSKAIKGGAGGERCAAAKHGRARHERCID